MHLIAKVKIYPTKEQIDVLWKLSDKCKFLYNLTLSDRKESWKAQKSVKYIEQQNKLPELKKNPELERVYSKVFQSVLEKVRC
jgi:putative transposase